MTRRRKTQNDQRPDLRGKGFAAIPHVVMDHRAWRGLSARARAVLLVILRRHNGYNNGHIACSYREMGQEIGTTSFKAIANAFAELIQSGFLVVELDALVWERRAREYRITWLPTGEPPHRKPATDEWRQLFGADTVSARRSVSADNASSGGKKPADTVSARIRPKSKVSVKLTEDGC